MNGNIEAMKQAIEVMRGQAILLNQMLSTMKVQQELIKNITKEMAELEAELEEKNQQIIRMGAQLAHYLEAGES